MAWRLIPSSSHFTTAAVKGWGGMVTPQWESVGVPFHWGPFHGLWFLIVHKAFFQLQADLASGISATASIVLPITPSAPATQSSATPQMYFRTYIFVLWPEMLFHKIYVAHYQTMVYSGFLLSVCYYSELQPGIILHTCLLLSLTSPPHMHWSMGSKAAEFHLLSTMVSLASGGRSQHTLPPHSSSNSKALSLAQKYLFPKKIGACSKTFLVEIDKQSWETRSRVAATQTNLFMKDDCAYGGKTHLKTSAKVCPFLRHPWQAGLLRVSESKQEDPLICQSFPKTESCHCKQTGIRHLSVLRPLC